MSTLTVAATQMACGPDPKANILRAEKLVRAARAKGAQIVLLPELFETSYFCKEIDPQALKLARPAQNNSTIMRMQKLAAELQVVLPISFFELDNNVQFNSLAMIDAGGELLGIYRQAHIRDGAGHFEKYYFSPGDTQFQVWETRYGRVGAAVGWDQWFPETARILALRGADVICYPSAMGAEAADPLSLSRGHWQRTVQGHAAANKVPVIASNRIGRESSKSGDVVYYGSSFIAGIDGRVLIEANEVEQTAAVATFDIEANRQARVAWGLFRDRRVSLYRNLMTLDGGATTVG